MKKSILISREGEETRVCLLESGKLVNIDNEGPSGASIIGNIYKGRISDIHRGLNAAFVDIGEGKEGFLSIQDIHPAILESYDHRPHMSQIFKRGQEILVQALRDPVGGKGAMLTTCISLPGRYVVLMPAVEKVGISKKLADEERKRLRDIVAEVEIPDGFGIIVRTAGAERKKTEILRDLNQLVSLWNQIEKVYGESKAPSLVVQEQSVAVRFLREYLTTDVDEIMVDDAVAHKEVNRFLNLVMPRFKKQLKHYTDKIPLFVRYSVENQIEKMFLRDVPLPSGGSIVIDKTEALIAIDVNSGRHKEKNVEETALRTNLEAAEEVASQVMLRDLSGLLVIDFIDMYQSKNRTEVQKRMRDCLKDDKAKHTVGRISQFGLLEMSRQRLRSGVVSRATEQCTHCGGLGYRRTTPSSGLHILRRVRELAVAGNADLIKITCPVPVANFMQNSLRDLINQVEHERNIKVVIEGNADAVSETIEQVRLEKEEKSNGPDPVAAPIYGKEPAAEAADRKLEPAGEVGSRTGKVLDSEPAEQSEPQERDLAKEKEDKPAPKKRSRSRSRRKKPEQNGESKTDRAEQAEQDGKKTEPQERDLAKDKKTDSDKGDDKKEEPKKRSRSRSRKKKPEQDGQSKTDRAEQTEHEDKKSETKKDDDKKEEPRKRPRSRSRSRKKKPEQEGQSKTDRAEQTEHEGRKSEPRERDLARDKRPEPTPPEPPRDIPRWDVPAPYEPGQDTLLDKVIKKLLKLDR